MDTTKALTVTGTAISVSVSAEAFHHRDTLLDKATAIVAINDADQATSVGAIVKDLKTFASQIEALRTSANAPLLSAQRDINAKAKELTAAIDTELKRLQQVAGAWDVEQKRLADLARQQAWEKQQEILREAARKEQEEADRLRKIQEEADAKAEEDAREAHRKAQAEADAIKAKADAEAAALAAKSNRARTDASRDRIAQEAADAKARADALIAAAKVKAEAAAADALAKAEQDKQDAAQKAEREAESREEAKVAQIVDVHTEAAALSRGKVPGLRTKMKVEYRITSIRELYLNHPNLVKLVPQDGMIKSTLANMEEGESLQGVEHWFVPVSQ